MGDHCDFVSPILFDLEKILFYCMAYYCASAVDRCGDLYKSKMSIVAEIKKCKARFLYDAI